ncbi:MAG: hypothetical protein HYZ51_01575 [Candidatus Doudnabacteria bacterium]|nr:hypothetical protein [Candidatus Doudnabacteria bacterium]
MPEHKQNRREFLAKLGAAGVGALAGGQIGKELGLKNEREGRWAEFKQTMSSELSDLARAGISIEVDPTDDWQLNSTDAVLAIQALCQEIIKYPDGVLKEYPAEIHLLKEIRAKPPDSEGWTRIPPGAEVFLRNNQKALINIRATPETLNPGAHLPSFGNFLHRSFLEQRLLSPAHRAISTPETPSSKKTAGELLDPEERNLVAFWGHFMTLPAAGRRYQIKKDSRQFKQIKQLWEKLSGGVMNEEYFEELFKDKKE